MTPFGFPSPSRVLVVLVAGIGDLVLSTPALRALDERFPEAHIALLTSVKAAPLARAIPHLDEVAVLSDPVSLLSRPHFFTLFRALASLRKKKYDLLVNLYSIRSLRGSLAMRLLNKAVAATRTAGRNTDGRGAFYDIQWPENYDSSAHEIDIMLALVEMVGARARSDRPALGITQEARRLAEGWLKDKSNSPVVAIHPGSAPRKRWPARSYARLAGEIHKNWKATIFWVAGHGEAELIQSIQKELVFKTRALEAGCDLLALAALFERSDLMIGNDSGLMHMAAALGIPVLAIFGPSRLDKFDPRRHGPAVRVLTNPLHVAAIEDIRWEQVLETANQMLSERFKQTGSSC